jgi:ribosomal-protein-alanine N-acetyltransferase
MTSEDRWTIQPAGKPDRVRLQRLISNARCKHQHLDWFRASELLEQQPFLLALEGRKPVACLACPPDPPDVAWIRLCMVSSQTRPTLAWERLWPRAAQLAREHHAIQAAALATGGWLDGLLQSSGFEHTTDVVFLEWLELKPPHPSTVEGSLRTMRHADLDAVSTVDQYAFKDIWRLSNNTLQQAFYSSSYASLLEKAGEPVGYQITTRSPYGGHIARLAVHPSHQGQGLGRALVVDVLQRISPAGNARVTVNTQIDNARSLRLYKRLGFRETDSRHPVFQCNL